MLRLLTTALTLIVSACALMPQTTPSLIRDEADIFSPQAEAAAEARLREAAGDDGVLLFIITGRDVDPPVAFDGTTDWAAENGRDAAAWLIDGARIDASATTDPNGLVSLQPPPIDRMLEEGRGDEALDLMVRTYEAWARSP
jgi:hypothetical protein